MSATGRAALTASAFGTRARPKASCISTPGWTSRRTWRRCGALRFKIAVATFDRLPRLIEQTREQEQECLDRIERLTSPNDLDALLDPDAEWAPTGRLVLRRTDVKLLQAQIEALQEARAEMKRALRRYATRASQPPA